MKYSRESQFVCCAIYMQPETEHLLQNSISDILNMADFFWPLLTTMQMCYDNQARLEFYENPSATRKQMTTDGWWRH